jgi:hypothetical protein
MGGIRAALSGCRLARGGACSASVGTGGRGCLRRGPAAAPVATGAGAVDPSVTGISARPEGRTHVRRRPATPEPDGCCSGW